MLNYSQPLLPLFLLIAAWGGFRYRRPGSRKWIVVGLAGIFLICCRPTEWLFSRVLESSYSAAPPAFEDAQAIVVLSAKIGSPQPGRPYALPGWNTYERTVYAAWLYQHRRPLPILACGGTFAGDVPPAAVVMRQVLQKEGIAGSSIWTEERSLSTYENALFGAAILRRQGISRIVLVTEAYHMLRAELCFRKQGLAVIPAPCRFTLPPRFFDLFPEGNTLDSIECMLHEVVGLAWYKIRGRV